MSLTYQDSKAVIEAALFAAGRTLSLKELAVLSGLPEEKAGALAEELSREYSSRSSGLEIRSFGADDRGGDDGGNGCGGDGSRSGRGYSMQVRSVLTPQIISIAPKEIEAPLIRTLAIIAYKQPIRQSDLAEIRGNKSYAHVKDLERMGLISAVRQGRTKVITTTRAFSEYFGLSSAGPEAVRRAITRSKKPLGVTPMYESLATRLGLDYLVINPYRPDEADIERLKEIDLLIAAPGYAERIREHYSGEVIEAGVRTLSQLKESAERIVQARGGEIEPLAAEIDALLQQYRDSAKASRPIQPLTPMIEEIARDLRIPVSAEGITAVPDYAGLEGVIIVPTHQPYDMDILERIRQRYEKILGH
jgi:segregation and condensation protein B